MTFEDALHQEFRDVDKEKWFALAISTKSLDKTPDSVFGITLGDATGEILYQKFFGTDITDESLMYDRLDRSAIDESGRLDFVMSDLLDIIPENAHLFSSHANTWAKPLFENMTEVLGDIMQKRCVRHCDIRALIRLCRKYPHPQEGQLFHEWLADLRLPHRWSLFQALEEVRVFDNTMKPAATSKAEGIGRALANIVDKELQVESDLL